MRGSFTPWGLPDGLATAAAQGMKKQNFLVFRRLLLFCYSSEDGLLEDKEKNEMNQICFFVGLQEFFAAVSEMTGKIH